MTKSYRLNAYWEKKARMYLMLILSSLKKDKAAKEEAFYINNVLKSSGPSKWCLFWKYPIQSKLSPINWASYRLRQHWYSFVVIHEGHRMVGSQSGGGKTEKRNNKPFCRVQTPVHPLTRIQHRCTALRKYDLRRNNKLWKKHKVKPRNFEPGISLPQDQTASSALCLPSAAVPMLWYLYKDSPQRGQILYLEER